VAGRERPSELRLARLVVGRGGDAAWLEALQDLEPVDPVLLLAPPGSVAELIEPPQEVRVGDDWSARRAMAAWVEIRVPGGHTVTREVFFERDAAALRERPEELLLAAIQAHLGETDPLALYDQLAADLDAGGSAVAWALEPAALPPPLRPAFRELFGLLARIRSLEAVPIASAEGEEARRQIIQAEWSGFRRGLRAGRAWREAELREQLGEIYEIGVARDAALAEAEAKGNETKKAQSLAEERALYRVWKPQAEDIKAREPLAKRWADALLRQFTEQSLREAATAELEALAGYRRQLGKWSWPSEDRVTKMIRWWERGHDPTRAGAPTWRELEDGEARL